MRLTARITTPAVSFVGMIRFRFKGSSSRTCRNLSPPRRAPLQATRTERAFVPSASANFVGAAKTLLPTAKFSLNDRRISELSSADGKASLRVESWPEIRTFVHPVNPSCYQPSGLTLSGLRSTRVSSIGMLGKSAKIRNQRASPACATDQGKS